MTGEEQGKNGSNDELLERLRKLTARLGQGPHSCGEKKVFWLFKLELGWVTIDFLEQGLFSAMWTSGANNHNFKIHGSSYGVLVTAEDEYEAWYQPKNEPMEEAEDDKLRLDILNKVIGFCVLAVMEQERRHGRLLSRKPRINSTKLQRDRGSARSSDDSRRSLERRKLYQDGSIHNDGDLPEVPDDGRPGGHGEEDGPVDSGASTESQGKV